VAVTGETVTLPVGEHDVSLCCHSDSPGAVQIVTAARQIVDEFNAKNGFGGAAAAVTAGSQTEGSVMEGFQE